MRSRGFSLALVLCIGYLSGCLHFGGEASPPGSGRETGRSYLVGEQKEASGYGLYSYILFGSPPTGDTEQRYLKTFEAYLTIPPLPSMQAFLTPNQLNITYLMFESPPPAAAAECLQTQCVDIPPDTLQWMLRNYAYGRARVLLSALPGDYRQGPYIVSYFKPITGAEPIRSKYLFQDLSAVPPNLVVLWVKEFQRQAARQEYWEEQSAGRLALNMRTWLEVAARGLPEVQRGIDSWIAWIK